MKFSLSALSALAAFAATALAQDPTADFNPVTSPEKDQEIPAGKPFKIVWDAPEKYADGTVSLHLIGGEDQDHQVPIADLAAGIPNADGGYTWEVDSSLGDANVYGLVVKWEADPAIFQYSNPFHIAKAEGGDDKKATQTTTIKKEYGIKTITLSSCDCEETPTSTVTPPAVTTPEVTPTPTVQKPTTIKTKPAVTKTKEVEEEEPTETEIEEIPSETPETIPEEGAGVRFGASSVALVGAFVVAALSL